MGNVLFYGALVLLGISVVLFFLQQIVCSGKDLDIFKKLLKDRNYPVEFAEKSFLYKVEGRDDFNSCWIKIICRKRTVTEETLLHHAKWMGRCGGFALFLSFSKLSSFLTFLLAILFAFSIVGIYRGFIACFFEIKKYKKAWRLYKSQR